MTAQVKTGGSSPKVVALRNGVGLTKLYAELAEGRLVGHKIGARTVIYADDEAAWQRSLPKYQPSQSAA